MAGTKMLTTLFVIASLILSSAYVIIEDIESDGENIDGLSEECWEELARTYLMIISVYNPYGKAHDHAAILGELMERFDFTKCRNVISKIDIVDNLEPEFT